MEAQWSCLFVEYDIVELEMARSLEKYTRCEGVAIDTQLTRDAPSNHVRGRMKPHAFEHHCLQIVQLTTGNQLCLRICVHGTLMKSTEDGRLITWTERLF